MAANLSRSLHPSNSNTTPATSGVHAPRVVSTKAAARPGGEALLIGQPVGKAQGHPSAKSPVLAISAIDGAGSSDVPFGNLPGSASMGRQTMQTTPAGQRATRATAVYTVATRAGFPPSHPRDLH